MRTVSRARAAPPAPSPRGGGGQRGGQCGGGGGAGRTRAAAAHAAVAGAGGRVLRGRRVPVPARRTPHETTRGRNGHHPYQTQTKIQE